MRGDNGDASFLISVLVLKSRQNFGRPNLMEDIYNARHDDNMSLRRPDHDDHFLTVQ